MGSAVGADAAQPVMNRLAQLLLDPVPPDRRGRVVDVPGGKVGRLTIGVGMQPPGKQMGAAGGYPLT